MMASLVADSRREILRFPHEWTGSGSLVGTTMVPGSCRLWAFCLLLSKLITVAIPLPLEDRTEALFTEWLPVGSG